MRPSYSFFCDFSHWNFIHSPGAAEFCGHGVPCSFRYFRAICGSDRHFGGVLRLMGFLRSLYCDNLDERFFFWWPGCLLDNNQVFHQPNALVLCVRLTLRLPTELQLLDHPLTNPLSPFPTFPDFTLFEIVAIPILCVPLLIKWGAFSVLVKILGALRSLWALCCRSAVDHPSTPPSRTGTPLSKVHPAAVPQSPQ